MGKLDQMDFERVRAELMPRDKATITSDGILFGELLYSCPEARARGWLVEGRRHRKPLEIAFDYRLVDEIVVYSPDGSGESFVASLVKDSVRFKGMALADVTRHFKAVRELTAPAGEVNRQALFEYNIHAKPINARATAGMRAVVRGKSRSCRKKDTTAARAQELAAERGQTGGFHRVPPHKAPPMRRPQLHLAKAPRSARRSSLSSRLPPRPWPPPIPPTVLLSRLATR